MIDPFVTGDQVSQIDSSRRCGARNSGSATRRRLERTKSELSGSKSADHPQKLDKARRDLLDLGLRNTLLNFNPLKSKGVEIVDELPPQVYRTLVSLEQPMVFLAQEVPETTTRQSSVAGGEPRGNDLQFTQPEIEEEDEDGEITARHRDNKLQTPYTQHICSGVC